MTDIEAIYRLLINLLWSAQPQPPQKSVTFLQSLKSTLTNLYKDSYNEGIRDCQKISSSYRRSEEESKEIEALIKK